MDDDVFLGTSGPAVGRQQFHQNAQSAAADFLYTDTVGILVESEWGGLSQTGIQLCPALYIPTAAQIPQAVKHIYSRLAAAATELDQGVPDLLLSLVGTGNSFSFENSDRLVRGLSQLINRCSLWAISSGEQSDPLAVAISTALRSTLAQTDSSEETLLIVVNSSDVRHVGNVNSPPPPQFSSNNGKQQQQQRPRPTMTDARLNTFYLVWTPQQQKSPREQEVFLFRACTAIKLANPPPALLIGVPEERASATGIGPPIASSMSQAQTPMSTGPAHSPTILLPSSPSNERQPLPLVLFCGATLPSLLELIVSVQCGVPALVVQDISELCVLLKASFTLFQSAGFDHCTFDCWLDRELRMVALATAGHYEQSEIREAKSHIFQLLLTVSSAEHSLLAFMPAQQLDNLGEHVVDLLVRWAPEPGEMGRALGMAVKMGAARTLNSIRLEGLFGGDQLEALLRSALVASGAERWEVLAALLDQNLPLAVTPELLAEWAEKNGDQYFFNVIILGHLLGGLQQSQLEHMDEQMAKQFQQLMTDLCGGVSNSLFSPAELLSRPSNPMSSGSVFDPERSLRLLAVWALLLNRPELVRLFCAYSSEPMALCLAMAKSARSLAHRSGPWCFYKPQLRRLSHQLGQFAIQLLEEAYAEDSAKAYNALCRPLPSFRHLTITQLAYETNALHFMAHECCQRWILRLLYGRIKILTIWRTFCLPNWLKLLLSAILIAPIAVWIRPREESSSSNHLHQQRPLSPTVALLEDGKQPRKFRTSSANSMHSLRSGLPGGGGGMGKSQHHHQRRNSAAAGGDAMAVNLAMANGDEAGGIDSADALQQQAISNDDSTLTDSFMPSASQMRGDTIDNNTNSRRHQREAEAALLLMQRHNHRNQRHPGSSGNSRRHSPDRRSSMFYHDGGSGGGGSLGAPSQRRRSRANSSNRLHQNNLTGAIDNSTTAVGLHLPFGRHSSHGASSNFLGRICPLSTMALFYGTPIAKYWLSLAFRLLYLAILGWAIAQPGCFLFASGWPEQLLWLWALCWLLDSLWVFICRAQLADWRQHGWAFFDIFFTSAFLLGLLGMRICTSIGLVAIAAYHLRSAWAFFLLYECHKTLFVYVPLSNVLGPMLVRIRLMITRDLANFAILMMLLLAGSAIAIKATLYPDLSANHSTMAETFGWTLQQLFTTDLGVLRQSSECQRQLLPDQPSSIGKTQSSSRTSQCYGPVGGYADPRCPANQHWAAHFTLFHYLAFLKLLSWPLLFALFARTAKRVEEEAEQIWRFQLYSLATGFSLRPCLPPPLTPIFLLCLACCRFRAGSLSGCCLFPRFSTQSLGTDHPDMHGQSPHSPRRKFSNVYKNPSVLTARSRPLSGYWRRLAIALWKNGQLKKHAEQQHGPAATATGAQDKASLLMGFNALKQQQQVNDNNNNGVEKDEEKQKNHEEEGEQRYQSEREKTPRLQIDPRHRKWLHLLPDYRPNSHSKLASEFPMEVQKHVEEDATAQAMVDLAKSWRQRRLGDFFARVDFGQSSGDEEEEGIMLSGNGLPLNPHGRTGLAGRGDFARFGPNRMLLYTLFRCTSGNSLQVLVQCPSGRLPSRWAQPSSIGPMVDEFLAQLLLQLGLPDPEIHTLSTKTGLLEGQRDGPIGFVCTQRLPDEKGEGFPMETDNAWAEAQLWALDLTGYTHLHHQLAEGGDLAWRWKSQLGDEAKRLVDKAVAMFRPGQKETE